MATPFIIQARGETAIRIGMVDPLTGVYAAPAGNEVMGAKLADEGGQGRHRRLAATLQHRAPALIARLQAASSSGSTMAGFATRPSFAGHTGSSAKTNHELTSTPDHQMGAGHSSLRNSALSYALSPSMCFGGFALRMSRSAIGQS